MSITYTTGRSGLLDACLERRRKRWLFQEHLDARQRGMLQHDLDQQHGKELLGVWVVGSCRRFDLETARIRPNHSMRCRLYLALHVPFLGAISRADRRVCRTIQTSASTAEWP